MKNTPYRHSVWFDVSAVVILGAVVLVGAGYLISELGSGMGRGFGQAPSAGAIDRPSPARTGPVAGVHRTPRAAPLTRLPDRSPIGSSPLRSRPSSGASVPFSASWREDVAPQLSSPGAPTGPSSVWRGGAATEQSRSAAGSAPVPSLGGQATSSSSMSRAGWRTEARQLAGRTRALSNEIGQLRTATEEARAESSSEGPIDRSAESRQTAARDVPDPPNVPIDDHLHWLVVAALLWGSWRIFRGGG